MQTQNPNNMIQIYCTRCGKKLAPDGRCSYCHILKRTKSKRRPIADAVYSYCDSPMTLVLAFFWTLTTILTVIFGLRTPAFSIPVDIAEILMVVGLWMLHTCQRKGKRHSMKLISIGVVLATIITFLLLFSATLLSFYGLFVSVSTSGYENMMLPFTFTAVGLLVLLPFSILYLGQINQQFITARGVLRGSMEFAEAPLYAIFFSVLLGAGYLLLAVIAGPADTAMTGLIDALLALLPAAPAAFLAQLENISWAWLRPQLLASGISSLFSAAALIVYRARVRAAEREQLLAEVDAQS